MTGCGRKIGEFPCCTVVCCDCLEAMKVLPDGCVDAVITDPPYPDQRPNRYCYKADVLNALRRFDCQQFIFWSAKAPFPLDSSAIHVWDKGRGCASQYERIFERNGGLTCRIYRHLSVNSVLAAVLMHDVYTGHPSQKPERLMLEIIQPLAAVTILDPFLGSGTTAVAAKKLGRHFLGFEISETYCQIARERLALVEAQQTLFEPKAEQLDLK